MKEFVVLTLFPESFQSFLQSSLLGKALQSEKTKIHFYQLRDFSEDKHKTVDDTPFGGGEGMLLRFDVLSKAVEKIKSDFSPNKIRVVYLSPQGKKFSQIEAKKHASNSDVLLLVCGHYEGVDERFIETYVEEEISLGDYVLTGGESAAMVVLDCMVRLLPGVVGNASSITNDSHENGLLKYPQYTKPREYLGKTVPDVLLSGDHEKIKKWRDEKSISVTKKKRPDLLP